MAWEATSGIGIGILSGPTDATGTYEFGNLPNGDYVVSVWESYGATPPCDGSTPDYFDEWFGGALGTDFFAGMGEFKLDNPPLIETASPVTISGADVSVDFALTPFCAADFDGDGIPDCIDPDDDNDGIPDDSDAVPQSDTSETVEIDGASTGVDNQTLPDGSTMADKIAQAAAEADSPGDFEKAISKLTNEWKRAGLITGAEKGAIQSAAAHASIP